MKTLKLKNENKKATIKKINKFRLDNRNSWYQVEIIDDNYTHVIKAFNTWIQICRTYRNNNFLFDNPTAMDISVTEFKKHIETTLNKKIPFKEYEKVLRVLSLEHNKIKQKNENKSKTIS